MIHDQCLVMRPRFQLDHEFFIETTLGVDGEPDGDVRWQHGVHGTRSKGFD